MLLLDPANAITSVSFYRKIAKQAFGRSFLYIAYLAVIFSILGTIALKVRVGPSLDETFVWLEKAAPTLVFTNGKFSSTAAMPATLRDPQYPDIAAAIDVNRTLPVSNQEMETADVTAYLTQSDFYLRRPNGTIEDRSFSQIQTDKPVVVDAGFYQNADTLLDRILYPAALLGLFVIFLVWKLISSLFYSVVAMALCSLLQISKPYAELFNLAVYAQTLVVAIQIIFLFMPARIPMFSLAALLITGSYLWLALRPDQSPETAQA